MIIDTTNSAKEQKKYVTQTRMDRDLKLFWKMFDIRGINRKALLRCYSLITYTEYPYNPVVKKKRKKEKRYKAQCYICGNYPTKNYNIIPIKNGGLPVNRNRIKLCKECYNMPDPAEEDIKMIGKLLRNVV